MGTTGTFQIDGELFPSNPLEKSWGSESLGNYGTRAPFISGTWNLSLSFAITSSSDAKFFQTRFIQGDRKAAVLPHPITGELALFTGVYIDQFQGDFDQYDYNNYQTSVNMNLRVRIGSTGTFNG
jgi:hypothetical protein